MTLTILQYGDFTSLNGRIRENVRLQRCQIREVSEYRGVRVQRCQSTEVSEYRGVRVQRFQSTEVSD